MKFSNNALSIGSVFGIPIRLHISLLIIIGLVALIPGFGIIGALILSVSIFGSVALHELGHSVVARAKGGYIHEIVLYPFGGAARISNIPVRPWDEILVAMAGPAVSLALALIATALKQEWLDYVAYINWMLFFFNILPVFPMDGGRVFRAFLTIKRGRLAATRIAAAVGKYFCVLFVVVGIFGLHIPALDIELGFNPILAFIGFYIYRAGQIEYRYIALQHQAAHFSGQRSESIEVEVSPPPYAAGSNAPASFLERLKRLFHS